MTEKNFCNCVGKCMGECPDCPFDDEITLGKDLSVSRNRHHTEMREKKKLVESAKILRSKANELLPEDIWKDWTNGFDDVVKDYSSAYLSDAKAAWQRAVQAEKKAARLS